MKRRICSIFMALVLCIGLLPASARAAVAAKPWETKPDDWTELTSSSLVVGSLSLKANSKYYLSEDIDVEFTIQIAKTNSNVTLDLNGHVLRITGNDARIKRVIWITEGASFTLQDSDPHAAHTGLPAGGVITGGDVSGVSDTKPNSGGGVRVDGKASFTMTGGTIYNCKAFGGGGVVVDGSFTMSGTACIKDCTAVHMGGGVDVYGTFTMDSSASITGCTALDTEGFDPGSGGGIKIESNGTLNMNGGSVTGNSGTFGRDVSVNGVMNANGGAVGSAVEGAWPTYVDGRITRSATGTDANTYTTFTGSVNNYGTIDDAAKLTVTFDSNGGSDVDAQKVLKGQKITAPTALTRAGYSFDGWYTAAGSKWNFGSDTVMSNMTLSAKWTPSSYNITYHLNDGEAGTGAPAKHTYGTATTLVDPTRTGYTFGGWYTNANFTGTPVSTLGAAAYTADINLYAKWTAINYSISYELNGGTNHPDNPATYTVEDSFTLKNPTRTGYTFKGWTWAGSTYPYLNIIINQGSIGDRSFEANWTANSYKVKFDKNAADATGTMADQTFTYDVEQELSENKFSRSGYTFAGWSRNGETYADEQKVKNLAASGEVTLSARWTANSDTPYTVEYYYMDTAGSYPETVAPTSKTGTTDAAIDLEALKSEGAKTGFTFDAAKSTGSTTIKGDESTVVELYYSRNQYAVTFDSDGGSDVAAQTVYHGTAAAEPADPGRSGYLFGGWYLGSEKYDFATPVTGPITLMAHWIPVVNNSSVTGATHGTVELSPRFAEAGDPVTLTAKPDVAYALSSLTVTDRSGREVKLTKNPDGTYSFRMPRGGVNVKAVFTAQVSFVDVPESKYFHDAVIWAAANGITGGTDATHFSPYASCTRAQIVTFLWRAAGCPEPQRMESFTDVPENAYYAKAVAWAEENNITGGVTKELFVPGLPCTRAQAVTLLFRYAHRMGLDSVTMQELLSGYGDAASVPPYAVSAFNWALATGVATGDSGNLNPNTGCTRAQIVTFLYRLLAE